MKRLPKYLLGTTAVLILAAVAVLYAVPEWLKQREIRAAEADLALLAVPPAPPPSVKNGIDALWLLQYRTKDDAERADLMRRFGVLRDIQGRAAAANISVKTGEGLDALREILAEYVVSDGLNGYKPTFHKETE